jgi:hypothetical protein
MLRRTGLIVARKKTSNSKSFVKTQISARLRRIRLELFGEHGGPELARRLELPARTWYNYETGVTVPAEVMLSFIDQTGVNPSWLLTGDGLVYRTESGAFDESVEESPLLMIRRGLERLETQSRSTRLDAAGLDVQNVLNDVKTNGCFVRLPLIEMNEIQNYQLTRFAQRDTFLMYRDWVPNPDHSVCIRVDNEAMKPLLPESSVAVVDLSQNKPESLHTRMVIALDNKNEPVIRWLEHSGEHLILRAEVRHYPTIPYTVAESQGRILGSIIAVSAQI